jgi:flagellar biogenesis protein FliO
MVSSGQALAPQTMRRWLPVAIIGLVAVTAGIALPQALHSATDAPKSVAASDPAGKNPLSYTPSAMPEAPDPKAMLTRLGLATAGVLALCVGTLWFGRRWLGAPAPQTGGVDQMRLIQTLALGNRCSLHLVHVRNRPVLIAADPSGLKSVVPLPESFEHELASLNGPEFAAGEQHLHGDAQWPTRQS